MNKWTGLQIRLNDWAEATFPKSTLQSRLEHLRDELKEVEDNPGDIEEWADSFILLMHAAAKAGFGMENLYEAIEKKFAICRSRRWGLPDERGVVRHVKED